MKRLIGAVLFGAIFVVLPIWAAPRFGVDPRVALLAWLAVSLTFFFLIFVFVPVWISAEYSEVFPGPPEPLYQLATDIKLSRQVTGFQRKLVSQTGQPGQPGSTWVTASSSLVLTTAVVSSDPPRKLVTKTITRPGIGRMDFERTYTPVAEGTLIEVRTRQRMALLGWLLLPVHKRRVKAEAARVNARIRDYLATGAATTSGVGS